MKEYIIYLDFFGKKMKVNVFARSHKIEKEKPPTFFMEFLHLWNNVVNTAKGGKS